jgi:hypothetical protein
MTEKRSATPIRMPMNDPELVTRASHFHPWDAMAPTALSGILDRRPFRFTAETGCGGSTIVLSHASARHIAFAIEGENQTISELRRQSEFRPESVTFIEGESKQTLPEYRFEEQLDLVLLDGPHAYPRHRSNSRICSRTSGLAAAW